MTIIACDIKFNAEMRNHFVCHAVPALHPCRLNDSNKHDKEQQVSRHNAQSAVFYTLSHLCWCIYCVTNCK